MASQPHRRPGGAPLREARAHGEDVARTPQFEWFARAGLAARGVVYLVIGVLAIKLALGDGGKATNQQGALQTIAKQPLGTVLLIMVAVGLAGYASWRLLRAAIGHGPEGADDASRRPVERGPWLCSLVARHGPDQPLGAAAQLDRPRRLRRPTRAGARDGPVGRRPTCATPRSASSSSRTRSSSPTTATRRSATGSASWNVTGSAGRGSRAPSHAAAPRCARTSCRRPRCPRAALTPCGPARSHGRCRDRTSPRAGRRSPRARLAAPHS